MSQPMDDRESLKALLLERSVRLGDFTLSSGAKSAYYVDARQTTMTAEGGPVNRHGTQVSKETWVTVGTSGEVTDAVRGDPCRG